ncbi:unnamed protein product [Dibothriocephalus latus]|uniref:Uncharacterized protein n=1 Tax=Dibothriocephalus latus TaxID=60516 RepID=A0A3P7KXP6_DIBLA|nr:unnamed protein product [Dibothriocephalus latus]
MQNLGDLNILLTANINTFTLHPVNRHSGILPITTDLISTDSCSASKHIEPMGLSKRYRRYLSFILIFLNVSILFYERSTRSLSVSIWRKLPAILSKKKTSPYYNRYCLRQQPRKSEYGYASAIRQILLLKNASEIVSENDGPLIFYDSRGSSHSLSSDGCQHRCRFSTAFSDYQQAVIAVFTGEPLAGALPKPDNQLWALESGESPFSMPFAGLFRDYVTLMLTTNPESHVPYAYGVFMANQKPEFIIPVQEQIRMLDMNNIRWLPKHHAQRKRKVVALISNWSPKNNRTGYINELAKFTDVCAFYFC